MPVLRSELGMSLHTHCLSSATDISTRTTPGLMWPFGKRLLLQCLARGLLCLLGRHAVAGACASSAFDLEAVAAHSAATEPQTPTAPRARCAWRPHLPLLCRSARRPAAVWRGLPPPRRNRPCRLRARSSTMQQWQSLRSLQL